MSRYAEIIVTKFESEVLYEVLVETMAKIDREEYGVTDARWREALERVVTKTESAMEEAGRL